MRTRLLTLALAVLLRAASADATAGFAETHSRLAYNELASLQWVHPGDGCDRGKYCFFVNRNDGLAVFRGLTFPLDKINAPAVKGRPLILAQSNSDGAWFVYDLRTEEFLASPGPFEQAARVWRSEGLGEPEFADAEHGARGLYRTWASRFEDFVMVALMWLPFLLLLVLPVSSLAFVFFLVRSIRQGRPSQLVWGLLCILPALPGLWIVARIVAAMMRHHAR